ncbi:MAG: SGNH/GDSL hydrolase family protein, partial [Deltaproteobacteria bacterium]|nr:SGNH/GDSL hydrolase family protein [Deltaproteobacteria bacterium]
MTTAVARVKLKDVMDNSSVREVRDGLRLSSAVFAVVCLALIGGCSGGTTTADATGDGFAEVAPDAVADVEPDAPAEVEPDVAEETVEDLSTEALAEADVSAEASAEADVSAEASAEADAAGEVTISERCFGDIWDPGGSGPYYDVFEPVIGSHCLGTNHQDIRDVRRVVFLGDSVTSGTPPTLSGQYYRSVLADALTARFGLAPPSLLWKMVNVLDGTSLQPMSGDFGCCSKWGARTDDLMRDNNQVLDCLPDSERYRTTLVIMTVGGNDIASIRQRIADGDPLDDIW